ncbi:MAG TPA: hypothetical protein VMX13_00475 [Sedimentisphaerales bacterium]|nr:hypothetical protein [Sedimentisphaerales bacterium]
MIYKAYSSDTERFLSLPETGMGYQVFEAEIHGGVTHKKRYIIYNGELIVDLDSRFSDCKKQIKISGFSKVLNEAKSLPIKTATISLVSKATLLERQTLSENKEQYKHRHRGGQGAKDNPKESANGSELFVRLSAYKNDHRVDFEKKKLKKGSYTTTDLDYKDCVKYSDDPVDRYALPNDDPIEWAFYIRPKMRDELQRGIVQPAFGHEGGGIEVYFENGTSDGTFIEAKEYGKT